MIPGTDSRLNGIIFVLFVTGLSLFLSGCGSSSGHDHDHQSHSDGHNHSHKQGEHREPRTISGEGPDIKIRIQENQSGGYMVHLIPKRFKIVHAGKDPDLPDDAYAGHVHLYVDRKLVQMLYDRKLELPRMEPGRHVITAMLSDPHHRPYSVNERIVRDTAVIHVPDR